MQVTLHNDAFPEDQEFEIPGLGMVVNHQPTNVTESQVGLFKSFGFEWPDDGNLILDQNPKEPEEEDSEPEASDPPVGSSETEGAVEPIVPVGEEDI